MTEFLIILGVFIYIIIACLVYRFKISKWEKPIWEKIYFSVLWVLLIPLYIIYFINNKLK